MKLTLKELGIKNERKNRGRVFKLNTMMLILLLFGIIAFNPSSVFANIEINQDCDNKFPKWFQLLERRDCVKELENKAKKESEHRAQQTKLERERRIALANERKREEKALPCLSNDVSRMEKIANNIRDSLNMDMPFEEAVKVAGDLLGRSLQVQPDSKNIKISVAIGTITTTCNSDFYFLINIGGSKNTPVTFYKVWSQNAPQGYTKGYLYSVSRDYLDKKREEAKKRKARELAQNDHCAEGLSKSERLRRLALRGTVRQTSSDTYKVGRSRLVFSHYIVDNTYSLRDCD